MSEKKLSTKTKQLKKCFFKKRKNIKNGIKSIRIRILIVFICIFGLHVVKFFKDFFNLIFIYG